ncbi:hypothetical protein TcWFU_000840 [Taenia crassiceps]|uniref:Uncharacterized protein n=1 Tax=Taenia crassiceps TaxID=6207 RepID=A0ABR4QJ19_9CEST
MPPTYRGAGDHKASELRANRVLTPFPHLSRRRQMATEEHLSCGHLAGGEVGIYEDLMPSPPARYYLRVSAYPHVDNAAFAPPPHLTTLVGLADPTPPPDPIFSRRLALLLHSANLRDCIGRPCQKGDCQQC